LRQENRRAKIGWPNYVLQGARGALALGGADGAGRCMHCKMRALTHQGVVRGGARIAPSACRTGARSAGALAGPGCVGTSHHTATGCDAPGITGPTGVRCAPTGCVSRYWRTGVAACIYARCRTVDGRASVCHRSVQWAGSGSRRVARCQAEWHEWVSVFATCAGEKSRESQTRGDAFRLHAPPTVMCGG
ncbi:MAG: hypothetical protein RL385_3243, partial [Pseudomonadota bacterium]